MENNFQFESASVSDRGLSEKRPQNEDSYLELPDKGVFAVADGVGGAQAGDVASQMAVEILGEAFINQNGPVDAEVIMRLAIERANEAIFQMATDLPQLASMATTVVALHLDGNIATIGHVGDSRLYRISAGGDVFRETMDHSVVEEEVRAGRMTPEQALNHPSRNVISRALGAENTVEIDLKTIMVEPGSRFLLCSDGITRHIEDHEIAALVGSDEDLAAICERLRSICYERGAEDNLTAVIVKVEGVPAEAYTAAAGTDGEEATVATARSPFDSPASDEPDFGDNTIEQFPPAAETPDEAYADADEQFLMVETVEDKEDVLVEDSDLPGAPAISAQNEPLGRQAVAPAVSIAAEPRDPGSSSGGFASKVFGALAMLILGGVIGAAGYHYWLQADPEPVPVSEPAPITEMKSNNTQLTAFEEGRRLVDENPQKYLESNAAAPEIPEDYFLLGRAYLLTGKLWESKRAYNEAKNRLAQSPDEGNAKTLAAEIAMALAIIESPSATEMFTRSVQSANAVPTAANTNAAVTP